MNHEEFEDIALDEHRVSTRIGTITRIERVVENTYKFTLQLQEAMTYYPGQYVLIDYDLDGKALSRAYTMISSSLEDKVIELNIERTEDPYTSAIITEKKVGDDLKFRGPYGEFVYHNLMDAKTLVMISVGIGVNTFISMINYIWEKELDVTVRLYHQGERRLLWEIWELSLMMDFTIEYVDINQDEMDLDADLIYICGEKKITNPLIERLDVDKNKLRIEQWY